MAASQHQRHTNWFGIIIPSTIFVSTIILNYYFSEGLFIQGLNLIFSMQQHSGTIMKIIQNILSLLGNPMMVFITVGVQLFYVKQQIRVIVHVTYLMIGIYFMIILKQTYQQPRPFWYDNSINILEWFCPTDFGNPSGHSFFAFAMYEPLLSDFIGTGKKKIYLFVWGIIAFLIVLSRMYLGAHSTDQVLLGSIIGLSFLVLYRFWLQQFLYGIYKSLLNNKHEIITGVMVGILWIACMIVPIVQY